MVVAEDGDSSYAAGELVTSLLLLVKNLESVRSFSLCFDSFFLNFCSVQRNELFRRHS